MSVEELIGLMVRDGMLIEHPEGGFIASPHPDIRRMPGSTRLRSQKAQRDREGRGGV